jgi:hypothetical protein
VTVFGDGVFREVIKLRHGLWGETSSNATDVLIKKGEFVQRDTHRGKTNESCRENTVTYKPRIEAWSRALLRNPQKAVTLRTP